MSCLPELPRCGCCEDMDAALKRHADIVRNALNGLRIYEGSSSYTAYNDYDSAYSDALQALWQALRTVDPEQMAVGAYLYFKVRQAVIDGRRHRGVDSRRPEEVRLAQARVLGSGSVSVDTVDVSLDGEWDADGDDRAERIVELARRLDPMLPRILAGLARWDSQAEIADDLGLPASDVSKKVNLLRAYVAAFPDLVWREGASRAAGEWYERMDTPIFQVEEVARVGLVANQQPARDAAAELATVARRDSRTRRAQVSVGAGEDALTLW